MSLDFEPSENLIVETESKTPSIDRVRGVLRKALIDHRFNKVPHVVNLLRSSLIPQDPVVFTLLAECYDAMDPPRPDVSKEFRRCASTSLTLELDPNGLSDSEVIAAESIEPPVRQRPAASDDQQNAVTDTSQSRTTCDEATDMPSPTDAHVPMFAIDRSADRSCSHIVDESAQDLPPCEQAEVNKVALLADIIGNLPMLLQDPRYAHLAALYEITTPAQSWPHYSVLSSAPPSVPSKFVDSSVTVQCLLKMGLSPQIFGLVSAKSIRCVATARTYADAQSVAAGMVIEALEKRAEEVRVAALAKLKRGLAAKVVAWKASNFAKRCHDAFKSVEEVVLSEEKANMYGAKVRPYGSYACGLIQEGGDVDIEIVLPRPDAQMRKLLPLAIDDVRALRFLSLKLREVGMRDVVVVDSARVPVLRFFDHEHNVPVDVTIAHEQSVIMSRYIRQHLMEDVRIWQVAMFVKYWSRRREISNTQQGFIGSIGWTIMALWFLQQITPAVCSLYNLRHLESRHDARDIVIHRVPWRSSVRGCKNHATSEELIGLFFEFYKKFDFDQHAISVRHEDPVARAEIDRMTTRAIFVEHPLRPGVNVTAGTQVANLGIIKQEIRRAHHVLINTGDLEHACAVPSRPV